MTDEDKTEKRVITAPTQVLPPGDSLPVFAGFEVQGIQGEGGMAKVYLAVDPQLDRMVAIKMISSALSSDSDFRTCTPSAPMGQIVFWFKREFLFILT